MTMCLFGIHNINCHTVWTKEEKMSQHDLTEAQGVQLGVLHSFKMQRLIKCFYTKY